MYKAIPLAVFPLSDRQYVGVEVEIGGTSRVLLLPVETGIQEIKEAIESEFALAQDVDRALGERTRRMAAAHGVWFTSGRRIDFILSDRGERRRIGLHAMVCIGGMDEGVLHRLADEENDLDRLVIVTLSGAGDCERAASALRGSTPPTAIESDIVQATLVTRVADVLVKELSTDVKLLPCVFKPRPMP